MTYEGIVPREDDNAPIHKFTSEGGRDRLTFGPNFYKGRFVPEDEGHQKTKYYMTVSGYDDIVEGIALSDEDMEELFRAWIETRNYYIQEYS
ncbi:hypothetical protein QEH42_gp196 [Microbacterium phage Pumpernickel]|uniref:Uncharacterized protein n=1 Tax=Microbacterium phage Pumpernickel TaxID=2885983 RepID=A0AAE9C2Z6_9CAUD|nr:hypothetical protein QEH42_gp196 [Microbacterium phage Pumpernickel]UDL16022.1 hypothetical protein SEA_PUMPERNICKEL_272 [Microbacterium phage Pumpernickel]